MAICFVCGKRLTDAMGKVTEGVTRDYHGNQVRMHKKCSDGFGREDSITARATTTEDGRTYRDDKLFWTEDGVSRITFGRETG